MKKGNSGQEGLWRKESSSDGCDRTRTDFEKLQAILSQKRDNVRDIANRHETITRDIKETIENIREIAPKFGETEINLYNKLIYINRIINNYQQFASDVKKVLNDPFHLQKIDWRMAETNALNYKQQINQFFNKDIKEIIYKFYTNGINMYNTISRELTNNNNLSVLHEILAIENEVTEDKNFVIENLGSRDLEKREIRRGAFDLLNRLDRNIEASRRLQQSSNIEYTYPRQENFGYQQDTSGSQPQSGQYSYEQQSFSSSTHGEARPDTSQTGDANEKERLLKNLTEGIVKKLALAVDTAKGSSRSASQPSSDKIAQYNKIVNNAQEILLNITNYRDQFKRTIQRSRERNEVDFRVSSMSEALENLRQCVTGEGKVRNAHLTDALTEIDKYLAEHRM
jgi:uncharacterized membrane protein